MMIAEGTKAPDFALRDADGKLWTLDDFAGSEFVLYFYPRDDTPGCTKEACSFRDSWAAVRAKGAAVLGVSPDPAGRHAKFKAKYELPFTLLADADKAVMKAYGAFGKKTMYGKLIEGVIRSTFVIDPDGRVATVFPKVKPEGHAAEVLAVL